MIVFDGDILNDLGESMHLRVYQATKVKPLKTAFHMHGRSGNMDYVHNQAAKDALMCHGYRVIMINARNSQNNPSDGRLEDFTMPGQTEDLITSIKWAKTNKWCSGKFLLAGHSMGGFSVLDAASLEEFRDEVSGVLGYAPVTDGQKQIQARYDNYPDVVKEWEEQGYIIEKSDDGKIDAKLTWDQFQSWADSSILNKAHLIKCPVALIAGENDTWVPKKHVEEAISALRNSSTFLRTVSGSTHGFSENLVGLSNALNEGINRLEAA